MIDFINGTLYFKSQNSASVEVGGIGYNVSIAVSTCEKLPKAGHDVKLYIVESAGMYGGVISLYGFISQEEREMFLLIKDEVPGTGAKKAMDYMDKISKSFADFKIAVVKRDISMLCGIFGFTKKTAEKLVSALKDKITDINVADSQKWGAVSGGDVFSEAVAGLMALGYKEMQARSAVGKVSGIDNMKIENIIKEALKFL